MPNLKINNKIYNGVNKVEIPLSSGSGKAEFAHINSEVLGINKNGLHDVTHYGTVNVAVSNSSNMQAKIVTPSETIQTVTPDSGYDGLSSVSVNAISSTYIGSGVTKKSAQTYIPGTNDQIISAGEYLNGIQTIKGDTDLRASNIKKGVTIFNVTGTYEGSGGSSGDSGGGSLPSGISALASNTIVPSDDALYLEIQHGLGVAPNFLIWFVENDMGTTGVANIATDGSITIKRVKMNSTSSVIYNVHYVAHGYNASTQFGQTAGKYSNSVDMTATIARMRTASPYMFKSGYTYRWICGVADGIQ